MTPFDHIQFKTESVLYNNGFIFSLSFIILNISRKKSAQYNIILQSIYSLHNLIAYTFKIS